MHIRRELEIYRAFIRANHGAWETLQNTIREDASNGHTEPTWQHEAQARIYAALAALEREQRDRIVEMTSQGAPPCTDPPPPP